MDDHLEQTTRQGAAMSPRFAVLPARAIEDQQLGNAALRVLCCLGTYSDKEGWCRPSMRTMAARLGLSRPTTIEHLGALAKLGYIEIHARMRPDGGDAANEYRLLFERPRTIDDEQEEAPEGVGPSDRGVSDLPTGRVGSEPTPPVGSEPTPIIKNAPIERTLGRALRDRQSAGRDQETAGRYEERFWAVFPSRSPHNNPKKPALEKFRAAVRRGVDPEIIIAGAERYAAYVASHVTNPKYIAQAVTWIHQERWTDQHKQSQERPLAVGMN
jgi:hypothetical protein